MTQPGWDERIARAEELATLHAFAAEVLGFYRSILSFQKEFFLNLPAGGSDHHRGLGPLPYGRGSVLAGQGGADELDLFVILPRFGPLLLLVRQIGPAKLAQLAGELAEAGSTRWESLLSRCWAQARGRERTARDAEDFFARAFLEPYAEHLAQRAGIQRDGPRPSTCPFCGGRPRVGVLRPEGNGAKRSLICSLCSTEWDYRRIVCPACGEETIDKLPIYTATEFEYVRVECCDTCKTYVKTVDLTKNGLAIPVVDELATIPLDLWAQEKGYGKLEPNLLGI